LSDSELDLLREPLISVRPHSGRVERDSLPGVLARLARGDVDAFPALRPHQQHGWHAFLVQLAAIAMHRAGIAEVPRDADGWAPLLLALTDERREPWCLVVPDLAAPAFMQPPVPEGTLDGFKNVVAHPDDLDVLVTTKSHDVKARSMRDAAAEHWAFTLVTLQTMEGYGGKSKYGIARMNGGYGSRPCVAHASGLEPGLRFQRDLEVLLDGRDEVANTHEYRPRGGHALIWVEPWDGTTQLDIRECDPYFIEVCRRVRLKRESGCVVAQETGSAVKRLGGADALEGNTGDPWTPVARDGKALSVSAFGFHYRLAADLLAGIEHVPGAAGRPRASDPEDSLFLAWALARGQGQTNGLHQRVVPLPRAARRFLLQADSRASLGEEAQERINRTKACRRVLHPALCRLLQADPPKLDLRDERTRRWLDGFEREVDGVFFESLWEDLEVEGERRRRGERWDARLLELARRQLEDAIRTAPLASARRWRAVARAEGFFWASARKQELTPPREDPTNEELTA
jgi:CRISPR system Cascade subunit CasA